MLHSCESAVASGMWPIMAVALRIQSRTKAVTNSPSSTLPLQHLALKVTQEHQGMAWHGMAARASAFEMNCSFRDEVLEGS